MVSARNLARAIVILYVIGFLTNADGKSIKKRTVTEMQLMHNLAEFLTSKARLDWLKRKLDEVMPPSTVPKGDPKSLVAPAEVRLRKRADTSLVANQDHQLAPGEKTFGKTDKADMDILSKVNPYLE
ncbi:parathyroid hormone [Dromiciops gliroides]|uniref:parathyroid hormone n=1 Tax=Dromiciops gliroides TaxID=33562 RepID=UPI001CC75BB7|nr:parathyroid hormone [Dromiciops gliroides]